MLEKLIGRAQRIVHRIEILARISEEHDRLTRTYGSNALKRANRLVAAWMLEAGLKMKLDNIGNVRGRLAAINFSNKTFVIGSHLDTVKNAGKYDGPLGLFIAIDVIEQLSQTNFTLPFNIEVVGFCDEEGVRFTTTYLGSSVLSHTFQNSWLERRDDAGHSLAEVIKRNGGNPADIPHDCLHSDECSGFFEVHIEQGPVLEKENVPVGIVTSIAGQTRVELQFKGKAGHAGTTPMNMRQDALCAVARFISAVEDYAKQSENSVIATVGKIITTPNVSNVIPGEALCSLDVRSPDDEAMFRALSALESVARNICEARNASLNWTVLQQNKAVHCAPLLRQLLEQAIDQAGIEKIVKLPSGAGHDAVALSPIMPVSMLFVRCKDGISHHPDEFVKFDDIVAALRVSDSFIEQLIRFHQNQPGSKQRKF